MTLNPYAPGTPEIPPAATEADIPPPGPLAASWRAAKRGARVAAYFAGAISLVLIIPAMSVTAFGLGSGRGFGVSTYIPAGIGIFLFFSALGGIVGASAGLIGALIGQAHSRRGTPSPGAALQHAPQAQTVKAPREVAPRRTRPRLWPWLASAALLLLLATAFSVGSYLGRKADRHLSTAIAIADSDDPHWRLDDLIAHRERVPDTENSALVVDQVLELVPERWPASDPPNGHVSGPHPETADEAFGELDTTPGNVRLSDQAAKVLRHELKSYQKSVQLARTLADYRRGCHELEIGPAVFDTPLPHTQKARTAARLLAADAAMRAVDGDMDGALDSCRAIFATGRSIGDEPFLISLLVRIAIGEVALNSTWRVLGQGEASDEAMARLQGLVLDELDQPLLLVGVKGERAVLTEVIRRVGAGEIPISALSDSRASDRGAAPGAIAPWGKLWFDEQQAVALDWMNEAVAIARRPAVERQMLWNAWEANIGRVKESSSGRFTAMLPVLLIPGVSAASTAFSRYQTDLSACAILLAAERHRRKTGNWPASIVATDRGILPSAPLDPFSGESFRMERRDGQLLVYSIGPNGVDEHGAYDPRRWMRGGPDDAGGQIWDVSLRRLTPATEEKQADDQ